MGATAVPAVVATGSVWEIPWHPAVVHFPIAFLFTASVLVMVRHARGAAALERYITPLLAVGAATAPVIVLTGVRDAGWLDIVDDLDPSLPFLWHVVAGVMTLAAAISYAWRRLGRGRGVSRRADLAWAAALAWLLIVTGLLGGEVVFG